MDLEGLIGTLLIALVLRNTDSKGHIKVTSKLYSTRRQERAPNPNPKN